MADTVEVDSVFLIIILCLGWVAAIGYCLDARAKSIAVGGFVQAPNGSSSKGQPTWRWAIVAALAILALGMVWVVYSAFSPAEISPAPTFELDASQQQGLAVKDLRAGIEFGSMATSSEAGVQIWNLDNATLTRSGGGSLTEGTWPWAVSHFLTGHSFHSG